MEARTATLAEIAREAGVSAPTVSKVLNGRADVAPATRTRVEELLRGHGYRRRGGEGAGRPSSTWSSTSWRAPGRWRSSGAWRTSPGRRG
ncbi:LacI family DNA-binding transcriptional regulator [Streptomyces kaempferi]